MKPKRLHEHIAELLRKRILRGLHPGDRLAALPTLAAELEVSVNTLRAALGILSEQGVVESRPGSGVYVADYRARQPVAVVSEIDLSHPGLSSFYLQLTQGVRRQLRERGLRERPYLGYTPPGEDLAAPTCPDFLEDLRADRLRGVISIVKLLHPDYARAFRQHPVPSIKTGLPGAPEPETNEDRILAETIRRLVAGGRRKIAILAWEYHKRLATTSPLVRETLDELGLDIPDCWLRDDLHPNLAGAGWEEFREIWSARREKPDALIVLDEILFPDVALAIGELGIAVPSQLHVTVHLNRGDRLAVPFPVDRLVMDPDVCAKRLVDDLVAMLDGGEADSRPIECMHAEYDVPVAPVGCPEERPHRNADARYEKQGLGR